MLTVNSNLKDAKTFSKRLLKGSVLGLNEHRS